MKEFKEMFPLENAKIELSANIIKEIATRYLKGLITKNEMEYMTNLVLKVTN